MGSKRRTIKLRKQHKISKKPSGGIAILIKKDINWKNPPKLLQQYTTDGLITTEIELEKEKIIISGVYLVPESSKLFEKNRIIWDTISEMINTEEKDTTKILTGDFNGRTNQNMWSSYKRKNVDKKKPNRQGRTLLEFCEKEKLLILNGIDTERKEKKS